MTHPNLTARPRGPIPMRPLTANERAWVEFIRLASKGMDPPITLAKVQALQRLWSG